MREWLCLCITHTSVNTHTSTLIITKSLCKAGNYCSVCFSAVPPVSLFLSLCLISQSLSSAVEFHHLPDHIDPPPRSAPTHLWRHRDTQTARCSIKNCDCYWYPLFDMCVSEKCLTEQANLKVIMHSLFSLISYETFTCYQFGGGT